MDNNNVGCNMLNGNIRDIVDSLLKDGIYAKVEYTELGGGELGIYSASWERGGYSNECEAMPDGSIYSYSIKRIDDFAMREIGLRS